MRTGLTRVNTPQTFTLTVTFDKDVFNNNKALADVLNSVAVQVRSAPFTAGLLGYATYKGGNVGKWGFQNGIND